MADGVCSFQPWGTFQVISLELAAGAMPMLVPRDCMSCPGGLDPATGGADWPPPIIGALIMGIVGPVVSFDTRYVWMESSFRQPAEMNRTLKKSRREVRVMDTSGLDEFSKGDLLGYLGSYQIDDILNRNHLTRFVFHDLDIKSFLQLEDNL
jgi:hypothetical protein